MQKNTHKRSSIGKNTLNILFISLDKNLILEKQADALNRHLDYARHFNKLNVIVFNLKIEGYLKTLTKNNLNIYPTNSKNRWFYIFDAIKIAKKLNLINKIDIVSAQDPFATALVGLFLKLLIHTPLNIQIHNDYSSKYWKNESIQNWIYSWLLKITTTFADSIRLVSKTTERSISRRSNVFIAPIAIDEKFFILSQKTKIIDIISIGRLVKQKNYPIFLYSIASLIKNYPRLKVKIIGDGSEINSLIKLIKELKISKNVEILGEKNRNQVKELLQKSKIYVQTSNYEGWGLAAMEAASCVLPVIMTDTGGARDIVRDDETGFIIPIRNQEKITEKIDFLLKNRSIQRKYGLNSRKMIVKYFSKDRLQDHWINSLIRYTERTPRICFIIPEINENLATHYPYTLKLFDELARARKASLFAEKGKYPSKRLNFQKIIIQRITSKPFNLIERFLLLLRLRLEGYKIFFIHYSYWSLFLLKIIDVFFPSKIFYWHAEEFKKQDLQKMGLVERTLLIWAIKLVPNFVTAGEKLKSAYAKTFSIDAGKIHIIPNWIETTKVTQNKIILRKKLSLPINKNIILFVHRLSPRKGAHLLSQIFKKTANELKDVHFVIIGTGPLESKLKNELKALPVSLIGEVANKNIHEYYQASDVFILPSLREGFPRVILEAMNASLPIVATDIGEVKNILPKLQYQYIVQGNELNRFCTCITSLVNNSDVRKSLGRANKRKSRLYNLETSKRQLIKIMNSV